MLLFCAEPCAKLGLNYAPRILKGLGGSNPPRSATESLSLGILRPDHRIARASGLICNCVVAEKPTFLKVMGNSRPKSLLANLARPFGPDAEKNWDGQRGSKVSSMR